MKRHTVNIIICLVVVLFWADAIKAVNETRGCSEHAYKIKLTREASLRYLLYLPWHYNDKDTTWPLLLYLHGGRGRGEDFEKMLWYPIPKMMARNDSLPFIIIAPLCPKGKMWNDVELLIALVDDVCQKYKVDTKRVYLAGYSMGGAGVWDLVYQYPDRFAAIAPMSGWCTKFIADQLKNLPVWVFHGMDDSLVSVNQTKEMIEALRKQGSEVKTSLVDGRGHRPPTIEEHMELLDWMSQYHRQVVDTTLQ